LEFLTGGTSRLPQPVVLHYRKYSKQGADGETYSVVNIHWERVDSWWYGHTAIYVSIGDNKHYGEEPIATIRGTYAIVQPLPSGSEIWLKLRHFPNSLMSPQGRS